MTTEPEAPDEEMAAFVERLAQLRPELVRLGECLCLAADVERPLLRRARLRFLPRSSSGLEAELWFSPLVEAAGEHSLQLDPAAATALRRRLACQPREHVEAVWACTRQAHAGAPAVTRWFEDLLWADVFPAAAPARQVARHLRRVLSAVGTAGEAADELGRWALHYVSRLPPQLLQHEDARRIQVVSSERLGLEPPLDPFPRPADTDEEARALVRHVVPVGVSARSDGLVLSRPPAPGTRTMLAAGGHKVRLEVVSGHARAPEPVRLEVWEDQSLRLRFAVVERLGPDGRRLMTFAHPGTAAEVAVPESPRAGAVHCAVLLSEGTIMLHGPDGAPAGRVPAEAANAPRSSLALSPAGSLIAWIEDGTVRQRDLTTGREVPVEQTGRAAVGCHYPAEGGGLVLTYEQADGPDPDRSVWATDRGEILARTEADDDEVPGSAAHLLVGRAPWQITSLAISADGRAVAAVGGDTRLLHWALPPAEERTPRQIRLDFCADRVFAHPDGGWTVAGSGGPVTLTTEDGDRYFVTPDTEGFAVAGDIALWARGCVVAVASWSGAGDTGEPGLPSLADRLEAAREHGVDCLAVGPFLFADNGHGPGDALRVELPPDREGTPDLAPLLTRARRYGLRVLADIDLTPIASGSGDAPMVGVLDFVRWWLDHGLDGVRVLGGVPPELLIDLRHLLDGYDERVLIRVEETLRPLPVAAQSAPAERSCHVVALPIFTHPLLLRAVSVSAGALDTQWLATMLSLLKAAGPDARSGYSVPIHGLPEERRRFVAAVLLGLPGCPMLPLDVLWEAPVSGMLAVRRDHLALTHGSARVLDSETPSVAALVREHGDERVLCLVNGTARAETTWVRAADLGDGPGQLLDLLDGSLTECPADGLVPLTVEACGVRWLQWLPPDTRRPEPLAPPAAGTPRARASNVRE